MDMRAQAAAAQRQRTLMYVESTRRAKALVDAGRPREAIPLLERAVGARSSDADAWYLLGLARYRVGDLRGAADAFGRRLRLRPDAVAHYGLGLARAGLGDVGPARQHLAEAVRLNPRFAQARARLAELDGGARPVPVPAQAPAATKDAAIEGPGELLFSGRRRLYSYVGRFAAAMTLAAVALLGQSGAIPGIAGLTSFVARVPHYESVLDNAESGFAGSGAPASVVDRYRRDLAEARAQAAGWNDGIQRGALVLLLVGGLLLVHAAIDSTATRYRVYRNRIDISRGVLRRRFDSIWLYEVRNILYEQPIWLFLGGTARLAVSTDNDPIGFGVYQARPRPTRLTGFADAATIREFWEELRDESVRQRRDIKGQWL